MMECGVTGRVPRNHGLKSVVSRVSTHTDYLLNLNTCLVSQPLVYKMLLEELVSWKKKVFCTF